MKLFIDDERSPPEFNQHSWVIARTLADVQELFAAGHYPQFISFDHDLGEDQPTGMDIARWICEYDMDAGALPDNFSWYTHTHSQNPIGKQNIDGYLSQYLKFKRMQKNASI